MSSLDVELKTLPVRCYLSMSVQQGKSVIADLAPGGYSFRWIVFSVTFQRPLEVKSDGPRIFVILGDARKPPYHPEFPAHQLSRQRGQSQQRTNLFFNCIHEGWVL